MTERATNLLRQALSLSDDERADLASSLIDSLDENLDENALQMWNQEIAARIAALDSGEIRTIPWDELRNRMGSRLEHGKKER